MGNPDRRQSGRNARVRNDCRPFIIGFWSGPRSVAIIWCGRVRALLFVESHHYSPQGFDFVQGGSSVLRDDVRAPRTKSRHVRVYFGENSARLGRQAGPRRNSWSVSHRHELRLAWRTVVQRCSSPDWFTVIATYGNNVRAGDVLRLAALIWD